MARFARIAPVLLLLGCTSADPKPGGTPWSPGKADGAFEIVEVGPLDLARSQRVIVDGRVPAFRVESFGGTRLELDLRARDEAAADAYLVVEGPLAGTGDDGAPGTAKVAAQNDDAGPGDLDAHLEVTLADPGVYRVFAGTYEALGAGEDPGEAELTLATRCAAACARPEISQRQFLAQLEASGQLDALVAQLDAQMAAVIPDPQLRAALEQQLQAILASPDFAGAERFPVVPLRGLSQLRPLLGTIDAEAPRADAVTTGELVTLLGACDAERGRPAPVGQVPGVGNGHFPNLALTRCQAAHSARLAQILTSLAADNGSEVRYQGKTLTSPRQLLAALVAAGHDIEVRNERTYANFISLTAGEVNVRWPVWLDTGIALAGGAHLTVPMGHSHHAWRISGPLVNARVMFYLGISGAAFFAQTGARPAWTGDVVQGADSTADGATEHVLAAAAAAAAYLRRNRVERATVAQGMPADGYGFVGVCNDSNAAIEWATLGTISTFPLMRAAQLDQAALLGDGLDEAVRRLPHDADQAPARADGLRRVLAMTPHALGDAAAFAWDAALRAELQAAEAELAGR